MMMMMMMMMILFSGKKAFLGPTSSVWDRFLFLLSLSVLFHVFGAIDKTSFLAFQRTVK